MICVWIFCFLQFLTLTASQQVRQIFVEELSDKIKLNCKGNSKIKSKDGTEETNDTMLSYEDENSGEYQCVDKTIVTAKIFVKFRTCENCIEMDMASIIGMAIGDVVATFIIGVGVYIVASTTQTTSVPPDRKRSDGYPPASQKARGASEDPYQRLRHKGSKDIYGDLKG